MGAWRMCDVLLVLVIASVARVTWSVNLDEHGRIQMGEVDTECDDGVVSRLLLTFIIMLEEIGVSKNCETIIFSLGGHSGATKGFI